ncbi:GNAT family N-acetyltransferase [Paraburkholderia caballeronis]|uniref:GNAT family N-acetyltransferase n=1 Tax=Paraburkholderia caballeronis TaxID=416943 RepID=UPI0010650C45|nr:GNAT family protein [Paraburkholderia caballeronis]TDV06068.1 uncharacterized protein DUF2824 [Paraburkholderia caballeronis]TDV09608.1 uncharacterized protein DUF2824 [Paraburkholderia caballeronis]TDV21673.1 uncharacterized protein DUF2824 [Paraburkholderia caballeronis]
MIQGLSDVSLIESVYATPAIRERIRHDHWEPGFVASPAVGYLGGWHQGEFCGFFMIREVSGLDIEIHACLLPQATLYSRVLGVELLEMVFNASSVQRVSAPIIGNLVSAMNFVEKLGFRREGVLRNACQKNGQLLDVVLFGMTRTDFAESITPCRSSRMPSGTSLAP